MSKHVGGAGAPPAPTLDPPLVASEHPGEKIQREYIPSSPLYVRACDLPDPVRFTRISEMLQFIYVLVLSCRRLSG